MTSTLVFSAFLSGFFMGLLCSFYVSAALRLANDARDLRLGRDLFWHRVEVCRACGFVNSSWEDEWACVVPINPDPCPKCASRTWELDVVACRIDGVWIFDPEPAP